jgi:hypothetical protein
MLPDLVVRRKTVRRRRGMVPNNRENIVLPRGVEHAVRASAFHPAISGRAGLPLAQSLAASPRLNGLCLARSPSVVVDRFRQRAVVDVRVGSLPSLAQDVVLDDCRNGLAP